MSKLWHKIYILSMSSIVLAAFAYLSYTGIDYYRLPLEERPYHGRHDWFKPSGLYGHGLGIAGTIMMMVGVGLYIARKRYNFLGRFIRIKHLLEFHIFLCVLGPLLILFHTAFKFGGIVSIAFWSMVAVVASGVIGRFIYIQIPRTIEGRELGVNELKMMRAELASKIKSESGMNDMQYKEVTTMSQALLESVDKGNWFANIFKKASAFSLIKKKLKSAGIEGKHINEILSNIKNEISLAGKIKRLHTMQKLFKYWHVAHLPFALIMLIIVVLHVIATQIYG